MNKIAWTVMVAFFAAMVALILVLEFKEAMPLWKGDIPEVVLEDYVDGEVPEGYVKFKINNSIGKVTVRYGSGKRHRGIDGEIDKLFEKDTYSVMLSDGSIIAIAAEDEDTNVKFRRLTKNTLINKSTGLAHTSDSEEIELIGNVTKMNLDNFRLYESSMLENGFAGHTVRRQTISCSADPNTSNTRIVIITSVIFIILLIWIILNIRALRRMRRSETVECGPVPNVSSIYDGKRKNVVSAKRAIERINNSDIKIRCGNPSKRVRYYLIALAICFLIPIFVYYMDHFYKPTGRMATVYRLDSEEDMLKAHKNRIGELTIDEAPVVADIASTDDYCVVFADGKPYTAIIPDKQLDIIRQEIKNTGSYTLCGFLDTLPGNTRKKLMRELNSIRGTSYSSKQFNDVFGKYAINYEPDYAGGRIVSETGEVIILGMLPIPGIIILLAFIIDLIGTHKYMSKLRKMSDEEYSMFEMNLTLDQYDKLFNIRRRKDGKVNG